MLMTIAIRGNVDDEVEAKTILAMVDEALKPLAKDDLTIATSLSIDIKLPDPPP